MLNSFINDLLEKHDFNVAQSEYINDFVYGMNFIDDSIKPKCEDELNKLFESLYEDKFQNKWVILNEENYLNNPYVKNVHPKTFKDKRYNLSYKSFYPYQPLLIDDVKIDNYKEIINLGYFRKLSSYKYLSIEKSGSIWMEITPHEIETMKHSIAEASGNVLVYGLGLGYYAYMISLKEDVKSITIVEKDQEIINLYNNYIKKYFEHSNKITIVHEDALNYVPSDNINYCFIDLWHDAIDGLPLYLKLLKNEKQNIKYSYWIEESLIEMIRRYIICILANEELSGFVYREIKKIVCKSNLKTDEDIKNLLDKNTIKRLLKK